MKAKGDFGSAKRLREDLKIPLVKRVPSIKIVGKERKQKVRKLLLGLATLEIF